MVSKLLTVSMNDEKVTQTLNYLSRNPKACFDDTTTIYSNTKIISKEVLNGLMSFSMSDYKVLVNSKEIIC